jgi:hypothetical protein
MKNRITGLLAVLCALVPAGSLLAHHSLVNFDTMTAVRVKGAVVEFHQINPHSFIFLEEKGANGEIHRWAVEGPAIRQLNRSGFGKDFLKPGDVIEVCGYLPKERIVWQIASTNPNARSTSGRLLNAEVLVMPDGQEHSWGDYGSHRCFAPGYKDHHSQ